MNEDKLLAVSERIKFLLEKKGLMQKDLADLLGKKESEISKWLSGSHNFTLRTISNIEAALDEEVLISPMLGG